MGTPDFAVPSLEALLQSDDQVVGVVTQPDKPKGRGQTMAASPIKQVAEKAGVPIAQPVKMKDPAFLEVLREWQPDFIVVTAFGRILPPDHSRSSAQRLRQCTRVLVAEIPRRRPDPMGSHQWRA